MPRTTHTPAIRTIQGRVPRGRIDRLLIRLRRFVARDGVSDVLGGMWLVTLLLVAMRLPDFVA